ncbi:MAG: hypothetical protein IPN34_18155 [Planctomycetes bacterium]|nr:hypothetical protein [Planctomycetota bacterium]
MKRRLRVALALGAAFVALWFAIDFVREWRDRAWIEARIEALRALGEPTTREELEDPPVPDEANVFIALESIGALSWEEQLDAEQSFPSSGPDGRTSADRARIAERLAQHPERSAAIAAALQRQSYRPPLIDYTEPWMREAHLGDAVQRRKVWRATRRLGVPIEIAEWLAFEIELETLRAESTPERERALGALIDLAQRPPIVEYEDLLLRCRLHALALSSLGSVLEHPRSDAEAIEALLRRLAAQRPQLDPLRLAQAHRAILFDLGSSRRSSELRAAIEEIDRIELDLRREGRSSGLEFLGHDSVEIPERLAAEERFLGAVVAARRFEARKRRWPKSAEELADLLPAGWIPPPELLLEETDDVLRMQSPHLGETETLFETRLRTLAR